MAKKFSLEAVLSLTDKATAPLLGFEGKMARISKSLNKGLGGGLGGGLTSLNKGMDKAIMGTAAVAGVAIVGAVAIGKSFIDAGAEVEKYKTVLKTMLGSQDAANARFEEMSKFAAVTPFELNDVVQLGNQLQALGQYSIKNMTTLGDLAAASGKPIDQVTGAFAKLVSGQKGEAVNMFRDLLISTRDWSAATGKGISKSGELMATTEEMMAALPIIMGKKGFTGMMDNMSKSYDGMSSNLSDTITRFKQGIGGMLLPYAKNLIGALTESIGRFSDTATGKAAGGISKLGAAMDRLSEFIRNIDWARVIDGLIKFVEGVGKLIKFITPLLPLVAAFVVGVKILSAVMLIFNAVTMANPIGLITIAIVAAIAAVALLVAHWNDANGVFVVIKKTIMSLITLAFMPLLQIIELVTRGIEALGKIFGFNTDKIADFRKGVEGFVVRNTFLSGMDNSKDAKPLWEQGRGSYSSPTTRGSESRSYAETRTVNEVQIDAGKGTVMTPKGEAPTRTLNYGQVQ